MIEENLNRIIFYDGDCGLCQRTVRLIYAIDKKKMIKYAPLQGLTYKKITKKEAPDLDTVRYYKDNKFYIKSSAMFEIIKDIGGVYLFFLCFMLVPQIILDKFYDVVANNRKRVACIYIKKDERFYE